MRRLLMVTMAAIFAGSTSPKTLAETKSYLGSEWINIGHPGARVEIKKNSIKREGNTVTSEFAYFSPKPHDQNSQFMTVHGKRIDTCKPGKYMYGQTKYLWAKAFEYDDNNRLVEAKPSTEENQNPIEWYVERPYHNVLLYRYLCDNLNPNYLKAGMSLFKAKMLLYANGFRIREQNEHGMSMHIKRICDTKADCSWCGNGYSGCYIELLNSKTGVNLTLRIDYGATVVIDTLFD